MTAPAALAPPPRPGTDPERAAWPARSAATADGHTQATMEPGNRDLLQLSPRPLRQRPGADARSVTIDRLPGGGHNVSLGWAARSYRLRALGFLEECLALRESAPPGR